MEQAARWVNIVTVFEQLPDPENRVSVSSATTDSLGIPAPEIHYDIDGYTAAAAEKVFSIDYPDFVRIFEGEVVSMNKTWGVQGHIMGTAIMGDNPATSLVNHDCRSHDHPNLFIARTSVMTTGSLVNPILTGAALSLRLADVIGREI